MRAVGEVLTGDEASGVARDECDAMERVALLVVSNDLGEGVQRDQSSDVHVTSTGTGPT